MTADRRRVAVVGSGVAGLTAAYVLQRTDDVTLFEAADRLGGHVHTHHTTALDGAAAAVDSGFIVCNDRTYPTLLRLFDELGVTIRPTEMSMAVGCAGCGLEYVGGRGLGGIFAQRRRVVDPRFWRLLLQIRRFQRLARLLVAEDVDTQETYGSFLSRHGFGAFFVDHYAVPVVACVWSSGADDALRYPAGYLFAFLGNHGFLQTGGAPQWYVVEGGSSSYVTKITDRLTSVQTQTPVTSVTSVPNTEHDHQVLLANDDGEIGRYDAVVIATHADEALAMLSEPTVDQREVLGAFEYSRNAAVLHRDASVLADDRRARGSWNYRMPACGEHGPQVQASYWMNRLQHHDERSPLVVTLNPASDVPAAAVIARMSYTHPVYTAEARAAQRRLAEIDSDRVVFAGAYHGWGFHEDGCVAGLGAARRLGSTW